MKKLALYFIFGTALLFITALTISGQNTGSESMILEGGSTGNVPFPHQLHQQAFVDDCQVCHKIFPQEKGVIEKLKKSKKLKKQTVMNNCRACHKEMSVKGISSGPTKCNECHSG